jgi:CheY-like chemotaxis protein
VELNRNLVNGYLENFDFTIYEAENGEEALVYIKKHRPDLVLMDMKMPVLDGFEATKRVKADPDTRDTPVIALTAAAMKQSEEQIRQLCDGHLRKPVSRADLVAELMKFLKHEISEAILDGRTDSLSGLSDDPSIDILSYKSIGNLPELIVILESEILPLWEEVHISAVITDISDFAKRAGQVVKSYNYLPLVSWINTLEKQINTFDLDLIRGTLGKFPELIDQMKKRL